MSFSRFNTIKVLYTNTMPILALYSTFMGINVGISTNNRTTDIKPFEMYSNLIGYTSLGIITGVTYPISYPILAYYILYKNS